MGPAPTCYNDSRREVRLPTIVCVSDTHGHHDITEIPPGDILVHAGDLTMFGSLDEVAAFDAWLGTLPHPHKVVIAGNHDWCFQRFPDEARRRVKNAIYLEDSAATVAGLKFYGSPWQPWFLDWAFNLERGPELAAKWALIPADTDVLVTHGPPEGILDLTRRWVRVGDADLLARVRQVRPKLHVFGHIHEAAGVDESDGTLFVNASTQMGVGAAVVVCVNGDQVRVVEMG
jgi:predicted phosphohydrolase